jgi:hypothetical protein
MKDAAKNVQDQLKTTSRPTIMMRNLVITKRPSETNLPVESPKEDILVPMQRCRD